MTPLPWPSRLFLHLGNDLFYIAAFALLGKVAATQYLWLYATLIDWNLL